MSLRVQRSFTTEPLYLMDGSAFIYRGYYAFQNMARSDGFPTNALYIVSRLLLRIIREERPRYFGFILDGKGAGFRQNIFPSYKAQRSKTPEPLVAQLEPLKRLLEMFGLPYFVSDNFEADDYIASLSFCHSKERPVVIIGADKDLKQCLNEQVILWDPAAKNEKVLDLAGFREETGMEPSSWPDFQALIGDSSDNIPGIAQIGPKTALGLMQDFPTLEDLFARLPAVPPKVRHKLEGQAENAIMYRELTRLRTDLCDEISLENLVVKTPDFAQVQSFMKEFELRTLAAEVASMQRAGNFTPLNNTNGAKNNIDRADANIGGSALIQNQLEQEKTPAQAKPNQPVAKPAAKPAAQALSSNEKTVQVSENIVQTDVPVQSSSVQGSLLSFSTNAAAAQQVLQVVNEAFLPELSSPVAIIKEGENIFIACGAFEGQYTGSMPVLAERLASSSQTVITADVKDIASCFPELWKVPSAAWFDLSLGAHLLSPEERSYNWEALLKRWQHLFEASFNPEAHPAKAAIMLQQEMQERLQGAFLWEVFKNLETPLIPVLGKMQERGVRINKDAFASFLLFVQEELERLTADIYAKAGRVFNIRSSQQLSDVLFVVLGLPKSGKTKGGATSTAQETLEKLADAHPIVQDILDYRKLEKLRSTYLEPLPKLADAHQRIHTTFNQFATATGRLSSSNPNLQNIPIRGKFGGRMRQCFEAAPGKLLVCADYSQIELRVLAHLSKDPTLLDAFYHNEDIHRRTAALIFDVPTEKVTPEERRSAKTINFGLIYGMGAQKLGQELKISMKEAKAFIERYFEKLSQLKAFYDKVEEEAKEFGYVSTMAGRRRFTPDILSQNNQLRSQARRQAINTRIQGSAADIIKLAMLAVEQDKELRELEARLILQVHDELVLEVPAGNAEKAGARLGVLMREVAPLGEKLDIPLLVDLGIGKDWDTAH